MISQHLYSTLRTLQRSVSLSNPSRGYSTLPLLCLLASLFSPQLFADQTAEELPALFTLLASEKDPNASKAIEGQIWQLWLEAPDKNAASLISQVSQAMAVGQLDIALRLSNQLVDSSPDFAEGWNKRATVHYLMENFDNSVADIRETVRLEPRHFGAISGLGLIFMRTKNMQAALEAFEQVLAISPASINAQQSAERARSELGREI